MHSFKIKNNWGSLEYYLGKKELVAERGGEALVRFPNGDEEWVPFISKKANTTVSDHGKSYGVVYHNWEVVMTIRGMGFTCPIRRFDVLDVKQDEQRRS